MPLKRVGQVMTCLESRTHGATAGEGGVAYIRKGGSGGGRERNLQLSDVDVNRTTFVFPQVYFEI